jgi:hypothetical protein
VALRFTSQSFDVGFSEQIRQRTVGRVGTDFGSASAPVTIIEFSDFQCSFCKRFWADTLPKLRDVYIDKGKVRFIYHHFAILGKHSERPWRRSAPRRRGNSGSITTSYLKIKVGLPSPKPSLNSMPVISA